MVAGHQQTDSAFRPGHSVASGKEQKILDAKTLATRYEVFLISDPSQKAAETTPGAEIFIC